MSLPSGLYGFADSTYGDPVKQGIALAQAGCPTIQLRAKDWPLGRIEEAAHRLVATLKQYQTCFIVNDHVGIAVACGADGVHLGQDDGDIRAARALLGPSRIIGRSTHSLDQVQSAAGADYIGFGPIFRTSTKQTNNPELGIDLLKKAVDVSSVPVIAIGGITRDHMPLLQKTGVHGWAVIRDLVTSEHIGDAVKQFHPTT